MNFVLNEVEARVLGALLEKEITTPDYYPLSLNGLVNACNQKSNREPGMNLDEDSVRAALRALHDNSLARSVSAEMHSGFGNLRVQWPLNATARNRHTPMTPGLEADVARIEEIWTDCRSRFGKTSSPWLCGEYSIADAMYAPVVLRFNTYSAPLTPPARSYVAAALEDAVLQKWLLAAKNETWTVPGYEAGL